MHLIRRSPSLLSEKKGTRNQQEEEEVGTKYNNKEQRERERERERERKPGIVHMLYIPKLQQSFKPLFSLPCVSRNPSGSEDLLAMFDGMRAGGARSLQQNCRNAGTDGDNGPLVKFL